MKWVTNFPNPYDSRYRPCVHVAESMLDVIKQDRDLWNRFVKGPPQATDIYTVEELEAMGLHGLYKEDR